MKTKLLRKIRKFYQIKYWKNPNNENGGMWLVRDKYGKIASHYSLYSAMVDVIYTMFTKKCAHKLLSHKINKKEQRTMLKAWKSILY